MDFQLDPQYEDLLERARQLVPAFASRARSYDERVVFPEQNFKELREAGFLKLTVPEEYGGYGFWQGSKYLPFYRILETIASGCSSTAQLLQVHSHATGIVANLAEGALRDRVMREVVEEGKLIASCGSEAIFTKAGPEKVDSVLQPVEGGYRLTSKKAFASLAPAADYCVVYVLAPGTTTKSEGYTTVLVPKDTPGLSFEMNWDTMGMRATVSHTLILDNCFIPREHLMGQPGDWVQRDPRTFTLAYVANHLGTAQGVFDFVREYLRQRPHLQQDQVALYTIGEMDAALQATRTSMIYAARLWEAGKYAEAELASMRALHTSKQTALMVTQKAFDVCGARSIHRSYPLDRAFRDVRAFSLHFRESVVLQMLARADLGEPFHSKQKYGPKLPRPETEGEKNRDLQQSRS